MENEEITSREVFYVYAHQDEPLRKELEKHLTILMRQKLITTWHSYKIIAGTEWKHTINMHINKASIILLLISSDFIASDYCYGTEMEQALERHRAGAARVIPIILRSVDWKHTPFSQLQVLPKDGKPITSWSGRYGRDKAFLEVTLGIRDVITAINEVKDAFHDKFKRMGDKGTIPSEVEKKMHWVSKGDWPITPKIDYTATLLEHIAYVQRNRAGEYYNREDYEEALAIYEQALELNSRDAPAYSGKGDTLKELYRYEEALAAYEQALLLDPYNTASLCGKGYVLNMLHRYKEALTTFDLALKWASDDDRTYDGKGNALYGLKRFSEALSAHQQALDLNSHRVTTYLHKALDHVSLQQYVKAIAAYKQAIRLDPSNAETYYSKGNVHLQLQQYKKALTDYEEALHLDPRNRNAREQALQLDPSNTFALAAKALVEAEQDLLKNSGDGFIYVKKGNALLSLTRASSSLLRYERVKEARVAFKEALRLAPEVLGPPPPPDDKPVLSPEGTVLYIIIHSSSVLFDSYADPYDEDHIFIGKVLFHFQMYEQARKAYEQDSLFLPYIPKVIRSCARCFCSRGYFHFNRGEYELALTAYEQALKLDAHDAPAYSGQGDTLKELHRYKEALAAYQQALRLDPLDLEVQTRRNNILKMLGTMP